MCVPIRNGRHGESEPGTRQTRYNQRMTYLEVTAEAGQAFFSRADDGPVTMLNLLRFREVADYSRYPKLKPEEAISGREAYRRYKQHTMPYFAEVGAKLLYSGRAESYLIGPADERWDEVLLVEHPSRKAFWSFATNKGYLAGLGHRMAALADSRLLPMFAR